MKKIIKRVLLVLLILIVIIASSIIYYAVKGWHQKEFKIEDYSGFKLLEPIQNDSKINLPEDFLAFSAKASEGQISEENPVNYILFVESQVMPRESIEKTFKILSSIISDVKKIDLSQNTVERALKKINNIIEDDYSLTYKASGLLLSEDVDAGTTDCDTRSFLIIAIGYELNFPLHVVYIPEHAFVRWDDGYRKYNFETTENMLWHDSTYLKEWGDNFFIDNVGNTGFYRNTGYSDLLSISYGKIAYKLADEGNVEEARKKIEVSLELSPTNPFVIASASQFYTKFLDDYEKALFYANKLVQLESSKINYLLLSTVYSHFEKHKEALLATTDAYIVDPNDYQTLLNLGWDFYKYGKLDDAIMATNKARRQDNSDFTLFLNLALFHLLDGKEEKSERFYKKAFKMEDFQTVRDAALWDLEDAIEDAAYIDKAPVIEEKIQYLKSL